MSRLDDRREAREGLKALAGRQPVVAAVDLGASKVTCFIMKPDGIRREDRTLQTVGVSHVQSRGVRGGAIINLEEATQSIAPSQRRLIRSAVRDADLSICCQSPGLLTACAASVIRAP